MKANVLLKKTYIDTKYKQYDCTDTMSNNKNGYISGKALPIIFFPLYL